VNFRRLALSACAALPHFLNARTSRSPAPSPLDGIFAPGPKRFFDILLEDSWLNVYAGELEARPPLAPTVWSRPAQVWDTPGLMNQLLWPRDLVVVGLWRQP
jgi:hypothetical protein